MVITKDLTKEQRIKKEVTRLRGIVKKADNENKMKALEGIIQRTAFLRIACEDMEMDLLENGFVENFQQSDKVDGFDRERPVAKQYSTSVKTYHALCKQIVDVFDDKKVSLAVVSDGFDEFVGGK